MRKDVVLFIYLQIGPTDKSAAVGYAYAVVYIN